MKKLILVLIFPLFFLLNAKLLAEISTHKSTRHPIQIINGFLLVELNVNYKTGVFIIDSGAPGLVLNMDQYPTPPSHQATLIGIGGKQLQTGTYSNNSLILGPFTITIEQAFGIRMEYLEEAVGQPVYGLIGLDAFSGFAILIDYQSLEIEVAQAEIEMPTKGSLELSTHKHGHWNTVNLQKGKKKLCMIIDTGSKSSLIDERLLKKWNNSTQYLGRIELVGAGEDTQLSHKVKIEGLQTEEGFSLDEVFVTSNFDQLEAHLEANLDGVLGQNFFEGFILVFSKDRKKLTLYSQD